MTGFIPLSSKSYRNRISVSVGSSLSGQDVQKTITNFLHNVDSNGDSGFAKLLNKAFNMSPDQIKSFAGKGVHIVVETVITVSYKDGGDARSCFF